jgi:hypothetical protein
MVWTCEHTKNFGVNARKYVKSKDIGVQGLVHHVLWCSKVACTKSEWSLLKFSPQICIEEHASAFL